MKEEKGNLKEQFKLSVTRGWLKRTIEEILQDQQDLLGTATLPENLTESEAAAFLRVKRNTLAVWRHQGRGPSYQKFGTRVVYRLSDLRSYQEDNIIRH